MKINRISQIFI